MYSQNYLSMAKINLDTEPRFKELLKELGFKKTKGQFVKMHNEACLSLVFSYTSHNHVRYYYGSYKVNYPKIIELAESIGEYTWGPNGLIGYLMPQNTFVDWRLAENDSDDYYLRMIKDIIEAESLYVLPYMEKLSSIRSFIEALESGTVQFSYDRKSVPIAYFLLGEKEKALKYIDNHLDKLAHDDEIGRPPETIIGEDYIKVVSYPQENKELIIWQEFAEKFKNKLLNHGVV